MSDSLNQKSKGILSEINSYVPNKDKSDIIDSRAKHIISSATYLLNIINEHYGEEDAEYLTKRFLSSIRNNDPKKFTRSIKKIEDK